MQTLLGPAKKCPDLERCPCFRGEWRHDCIALGVYKVPWIWRSLHLRKSTLRGFTGLQFCRVWSQISYKSWGDHTIISWMWSPREETHDVSSATAKDSKTSTRNILNWGHSFHGIPTYCTRGGWDMCHIASQTLHTWQLRFLQPHHTLNGDAM